MKIIGVSYTIQHSRFMNGLFPFCISENNDQTTITVFKKSSLNICFHVRFSYLYDQILGDNSCNNA